MFASGTWQRSWEKLGAHPDVQEGVNGWHFAVWAPDVKSVHVVGDFNDWNPTANPLSPLDSSGIWQGFVGGLVEGDLYKFVIETNDGRMLYKADPYGFYAEDVPGTASRLMDLKGYQWGDDAWLEERRAHNHMERPLNIYEVHLGSWKRHGNEPQGEPDENGNYPGPGDPFPAQRGTYYSYDDLSVELVDYVRDMGYTHIEVMPVMEHPFDGSWGYQPTGYYAATARYGTPKQFMHFVDTCHEAGIGVILDWVPGGFCANAVGREIPDVMMIAEESTAWPLVTYPPEEGGLGFHYKWDMGWMNDTLHYMQTDFPWRPGNHRMLTFSMMYAFNENFILPLSHDEVVNGKCSLIGRMPGDWWRQFAGLRTLAFYQATHPGAQLSFMGDEIAEFIEWRYYESIEWFLTEQFATHARHQQFIKALNHLYKDEPAFWERSYTDDGFSWIDADNSQQSIITFVRRGEDPANDLVVVINFDPASYEQFHLGVPNEGEWKVIFNSDDPEYGGSGYTDNESYMSVPYPWNGRENSLTIALPGLSGLVLKRVGPSTFVPPAPKRRLTAYTEAPITDPSAAPTKKPAPKRSAAAAKTTASKASTAKRTTSKSATKTSAAKASTAKSSAAKATTAKTATKTTKSASTKKTTTAKTTASSAKKKTATAASTSKAGTKTTTKSAAKKTSTPDSAK